MVSSQLMVTSWHTDSAQPRTLRLQHLSWQTFRERESGGDVQSTEHTQGSAASTGWQARFTRSRYIHPEVYKQNLLNTAFVLHLRSSNQIHSQKKKKRNNNKNTVIIYKQQPKCCRGQAFKSFPYLRNLSEKKQ